jgi:hypothetical protein
MNGKSNVRLRNHHDSCRGRVSWLKLIAKIMVIMAIIAGCVDAAAAVDAMNTATTSTLSCVGTTTGAESQQTCTLDPAAATVPAVGVNAAGVDDIDIQEEAPKVSSHATSLISS